MIPDYRVLHKKRIPTKLPIIETWMFVLTIKVFEIDNRLFGAICGFVVFLWVIRIGMKINQYMIDPFNN